MVRLNLTKTALARKMRLNRTHLHDPLSGRVAPGPSVRQRLLKTLGGTFDMFFEVVAVEQPQHRRR